MLKELAGETSDPDAAGGQPSSSGSSSGSPSAGRVAVIGQPRSTQRLAPLSPPTTS